LKPRELCEKAWQEIASKFPDFKVVSKGQKLKKTSKNKDLIFEIYFQANRNNYADSVEFVPHIAIYSKSMKKANIHNGFVYGGELGRLLNRTEWHWYQLAGASYQYTVDEVSKLCEEYIIPLFEVRSMYIDFYNQLKEIPKENISLGVSEFYGSTMIEFAYINGIIIEEE